MQRKYERFLCETKDFASSSLLFGEGYIRKAVLESILYKKKNNIKDIIYNPSQVIAKNDKIHLSRLFKKNCLILPYCQTNSSSVWTEVIKFKGKKLIWRRETDKHVSLDYVLRYVGKDDYLSYNILERKLQMEQFMLNLKVKLLSSTLIAKAISNHAEAIKEGANIIAESINSSADSDATALAQFGDVLCREAFVNLKGYKL